jgi:membrane-associated protein
MMADLSDWLLALVPVYGNGLMALATFLSCLALPIPCSILMLAAGGFVAAGDLVLWQVCAAALFGAVIGDQMGFRIGRSGGTDLLDRLKHDPTRRKLIAQAVALMDRRGAMGIFLTRWLFAAVGPWANFAAGATGFSWAKFTLWSLLGEAVWVGLYIGLGHGFGGNIEAASDLAGSMLGILAGVAAMLGFGWWLWSARGQDRTEPD